MRERKLKGIVRYDSVDSEYLQRRQLRRGASWLLLWALGVGAVISGDFSGWNAGLTAGGFWGLAIATVLMATMYFCMVFCIAELSAALPHAGGFYTFTRNAFGPFGGYICGISDAIEYILTPAVIVFFIGSYLKTVIPGVPEFVWWVAFYGVFVYINILGVELTLKVNLVITALSIGVLGIFFVAAIASGKFDPNMLFTVPADPGQSAVWLPKGSEGIFKALPYAMWFYLAIEQLPLAAEEAHDTVRDVPKALVSGMLTLFALSILVLVLNSGMPVEVKSGDVVLKGAAAIGKSGAPLADGFIAIFGEGLLSKTLIFAAIVGLIASFHSVIYAYGRVLFSLSRSGYLPRWISVTSSSNTPARALILGGAIGLACTTLISFVSKDEKLGPALLSMAVAAAVISYAMVMSSYIKLKISRPNMPRPYVSPLGLPGAFVGTVLAVVAFLACFADPAYQLGVWFVVGTIVAAIVYFLLFSRNQLVAQAPEEQSALDEDEM